MQTCCTPCVSSGELLTLRTVSHEILFYSSHLVCGHLLHQQLEIETDVMSAFQFFQLGYITVLVILKFGVSMFTVIPAFHWWTS